jgi:hypothetical protein
MGKLSSCQSDVYLTAAVYARANGLTVVSVIAVAAALPLPAFATAFAPAALLLLVVVLSSSPCLLNAASFTNSPITSGGCADLTSGGIVLVSALALSLSLSLAAPFLPPLALTASCCCPSGGGSSAL